MTWTMRDSGTTHTSSSRMQGLWESGGMENGDTFSHTFTQVGEFPYLCRIHPSFMIATVTVVEKLTGEASSSSDGSDTDSGYGY